MEARQRYQTLLSELKQLGSCVLAFSGGLDSSFLLHAAHDALGDKVLAVTISTVYMPAWEIEEAERLARSLGARHEIIKLPLIESMRLNPLDRCYLCKRHLFGALKVRAAEGGFACVMDGTNADDLNDYRPGLKALRELGIVSPLLRLALRKTDIREMARELGLEVWQKTPGACLLTRMPHGCEITAEELAKIEEAELCLIRAGLPFVRVRSHGTVARIEVRREDRKRLFSEDLMDLISRELKGLGYRHVALELEGYQTGSMNPSPQETSKGRAD
jgi:pyridinium-3,5-biscarboxylic acid mononucleotide sulfurtransferase